MSVVRRASAVAPGLRLSIPLLRPRKSARRTHGTRGHLSLVLAPLVAAFALFPAACGSSAGREVVVRAGERDDGRMYFEPSELHVRAGEAVTFVIENVGRADHEFESDEAGIEEVVVPKGRTRRTTWTAPKAPGVYPVYCDLPGHREAGMELTLVVDPRP